MYILKNAWVSITRNKGRNILIGAIILVIGCAATIALAINNTANDLITSYKNAFEKEVTIEFNRESMMSEIDFSNRENLDSMRESFSEMESYSITDIESFGDSELITNYYYTYQISLDGENIEKAENETEDFGGIGGGFGDFSGMGGGGRGMETADFALTGYSSLNSMSEFINGAYAINSIADDAWDKAFNGNYVFINEELAEYNSLEIGNIVTLKDEDGNTFDFEIIGIFADNSTSEEISIFSQAANTLITNAASLKSITDTYSDITGTVQPTFIVEDYSVVEELKNEFYEKGLDETFTLVTNEEEANSSLSSLKSIQAFAMTFLVVVLLIGGVILAILNLINIRERKYEIGVLRTIGMSKKLLLSQFMAELLIVTVAALTIGLGIGSISAPSVSNALLASEISNSSTRSNDIMNNFGGSMPNMGGQPDGQGQGGAPSMPNLDKISGQPVVQAYDSIDAIVNFDVILELLGIGVALVLISGIAAMVSIQKFSPLTILKERS